MEMVCRVGRRRKRHWKNPVQLVAWAGWECLCEQQVRGRRSSTADVEGLALEGFREEDVKAEWAPPRAASCQAGAALLGGALQG